MAKAADSKSRPAGKQSKPEQIRRAAARRATAQRKLRIVEQLVAGMSVARIAQAENRSVRRVRQIIAQTLAEREIDPPAGFVQLQIARLNDAMMVAHTRMIEGDLRAIDRLVKLVGELDRYHGLRAPVTPALQAPPPTPLQIAAPAPARPLLQPAPETAEAEISRAASA
ncbi:MAG: hypothetical protein ACLQJL_18070 [Roseiarcus sp.]